MNSDFNIFSHFLSQKPNVTCVSEYNPKSVGDGDKNEWSNIKAITYDGAAIDGKPTKVFAYVGFPQEASPSAKVPAVVLVHGGTGHAYAEWIKKWNDRGYAAIAMDNTGYFPSIEGKAIAGREIESANFWHHGLCDIFLQDGYVDAPDNDKVSTSALPIDRQWLYHAVADTIIAHNILANDERVDCSKIGISGISWGAVIASIAIGYDTDYAFAVMIYGSAYLDEGHGWMGTVFSQSDTKKLWSAADRLKKVNFPVYWLCWDSDSPFSLNSNSKSYIDTKSSGAVLNVQNDWGHCHSWGWNLSDSYVFADASTGKRKTMTAITQEPIVSKKQNGDYNVTVKISPDEFSSEITAKIFYIKEPLSYSVKNDETQPSIDQKWFSNEATVNDGTINAVLPKEAAAFYVNIFTTTKANESYGVSTMFVENII